MGRGLVSFARGELAVNRLTRKRPHLAKGVWGGPVYVGIEEQFVVDPNRNPREEQPAPYILTNGMSTPAPRPTL